MNLRLFCCRVRLCLALSLVSLAIVQNAVAQELAPRAYWPHPKGTNLIVLGYQYTSGDIVSDPTLPITGVESKINFAQVTYQRTVSLFARSANVQFNLPYSWGTSEGFANGQFQRRETSAMADARFRVSVNLLGAPSMDAAGFQALRAKPRTIIGTSLLIQMPTGGYESDKLINTGTNRWAVKPALGLIWPAWPNWMIELDIGVWIFGDNDDFLGVRREQDPVLSAEFHLVKRINPGFWVSLDATHYVGGRTTIDDQVSADLQRNSRIGATMVFPLRRRHGIKLSYSTGVVTESGGDFENFAINYLYIWQ